MRIAYRVQIPTNAVTFSFLRNNLGIYPSITPILSLIKEQTGFSKVGRYPIQKGESLLWRQTPSGNKASDVEIWVFDGRESNF